MYCYEINFFIYNASKTQKIYLCSMSVYKKTINGLPLAMESKELAPGVNIFMVSIQGDPIQFPMVYKKEYGGWYFVDKMTLLEFTEIEKEISAAIEQAQTTI
jgi:hypothetical protein